MKKNLFYLFALICSMSLFTACSDDDDPENPPTVEDIVAEYSGDALKTTIEGVDVSSENVKVELAKTDADDKVTIILHNVVPSVSEFKIPNAEFAATTRSSYISTLKGEATDNLAGYNVKVDGTVDNKVLTINIVLTEIEAENTNTSSLHNLVYKGNMDIDVANIPEPISMEQRVYIFKARSINMAKRDTSMVKLQIKNFSFEGLELGDITLDTVLVQKRADVLIFKASDRKIKLNPIGEVAANLEGSIVGENMNLKLNIDASGLRVDVAFAGQTVVETQIAKITKMTVDGTAVLEQVLKSNKLTLKVWADTPDDQLLLTPKYELSEKAKIDSAVVYVTGVKPNQKLTEDQISGKQAIDFSLLKDEGSYVQYFLSPEDPNAPKGFFQIYVERMEILGTDFTFTSWIDETNYQEPEGWATSNSAASLLKALKMYPEGLPYPVSKDGNNAKVITVDSKGGDMGIAVVPAVTAGTLFLGEFKINPSSTLKSTLFGVPYNKKPISFSGEYSYTPGETYYKTIITTIEGKKNVAKEEVTGVQDQCSVNAILYEVSSYEESLDGTNINTSDKIVAVALLPDGSSTNGTIKDFSVNFTYKKDYDVTKKYKLAVVCSSSAKGDIYEGAPGSTLIVKSLRIE